MSKNPPKNSNVDWSIDDLIAKNQKLSSDTTENNNPSQSKSLKVSNTELVKAYLSSQYEFRYNTITCLPEWKTVGQSNYTALNDYKLNSLHFALEKNGVSYSTDKLYKLLTSDFIPQINPLKEYFNSLKNRDSNQGSIQAVSQTITVTKQGLFEKCLTKWLVATVANILIQEGCQNHTCLVLTGEQGAYKTTWLSNLCPKLLTEYIFTGKITIESNDTQTLLAEYMIVNIDDQLRNLNRKDENALKTLITLDSIKIRKPYDRMITKRPRIASFCGSVNGNDFLTDPSGSRRFLPFEVMEVNLEAMKKINMDDVWAEALMKYEQGFVYWFTSEEIKELSENNQEFEVIETESELLLAMYEPVPRYTPNSQELSSTIILINLESQYKTKLISKKVGEALRKQGFERFPKKINGKVQYVYAVKVRKNAIEIEVES
jgi:predicted P-loop ATPase